MDQQRSLLFNLEDLLDTVLLLGVSGKRGYRFAFSAVAVVVNRSVG